MDRHTIALHRLLLFYYIKRAGVPSLELGLRTRLCLSNSATPRSARDSVTRLARCLLHGHTTLIVDLLALKFKEKKEIELVLHSLITLITLLYYTCIHSYILP
jgi:hypothetical protein